MKRMISLRLVFFTLFIHISLSLVAYSGLSDTCTVHDRCETAIIIPNIIADQPFVCIEGCNINATPEMFNNACHIGDFPTVWYSLITEGGSLMNIQVSSDDIQNPVITLFQVLSDCNNLAPIPLGSNNVPCAMGVNGAVEVFGTDIGSNTQYLIAVTSLDTIGGSFTICVNTISTVSQCVTNSRVNIQARSFGGDLKGPFLPGEKVSVCMNVNSYTAQNNGCQWFQGLVPVFGNGWDPSSFDTNGQPLNATINGEMMALPGNGIYGTSTWDWFKDVSYHFNDNLRQVGDFDGNGTIDMCSILFDPDCPDVGGIVGGCCAPCWNTQIGTILPPGWFSYGIDGSCGEPGPPISFDWGDGNSCGGPMGPWKFCFDLLVRSHPDCLDGPTNNDLSLGFFTFADGEVGAWTGSVSACANDQPAKVNLPSICTQIADLGIEYVEADCSNSNFDYIISYPGVENWTWGISPSWIATNTTKEGENGYAIHDSLINTLTTPVEVIYSFAGYDQDTSNVVTKEVRFVLYPAIKSALPLSHYVCERDKDTITLSAEPVEGGLFPYQFVWNPGGEMTSSITLIPPLQNATYSFSVIDSIGCTYQQQIELILLPCHLDTIMSDDESNDHYTFDDPPIPGGKSIHPGNIHTSTSVKTELLKVYPMPATDFVHIQWSPQVLHAEYVEIRDIQGNLIQRTEPLNPEVQGHFIKMDLNTFIDGVYIVYLRTSQTILTAKFLKM